MPFKDLSTIFSRAFVLGYYLPAFFALFVLWKSLPKTVQPLDFEHYSTGTQLLIVAAFGIPLGLLLSGLNYSILRIYEGYPLQHAQQWLGFRTLHKLLITPRLREFGDLARRKREGDSKAAWLLDRRYPSSEGQILPTRFGNAVRAFEHHALVRWGLSTVAAWPRIELLLSEQESTVLAAVKSDADFLVNASLLSYGVGVTLLVNAGVTGSRWVAWLISLVPFVVGYCLYRIAVGAATRWGSEVRSCMDLHRLELYGRIGVRLPATKEEEARIANAINQCLLYGKRLPNSVRAIPPQVDGEHASYRIQQVDAVTQHEPQHERERGS
jgi:hypothetical protein